VLVFPITEEDRTRHRGLSASTFVAQPFWIEMQRYMYEAVDERLRAIQESFHAADDVKASLVDRYILTKELVSRIERFPQAAIDAVRESGE